MLIGYLDDASATAADHNLGRIELVDVLHYELVQHVEDEVWGEFIGIRTALSVFGCEKSLELLL